MTEAAQAAGSRSLRVEEKLPEKPQSPGIASPGAVPKKLNGPKKTYSALPRGEQNKVDALVIGVLDQEFQSARCTGGENAMDKKLHEMFVSNREVTRKRIAELRDQFANVDLSGVTLDKRVNQVLKDGAIDSEDFKPWKVPYRDCQTMMRSLL